jgi:CheY-like chemotaxis protein
MAKILFIDDDRLIGLCLTQVADADGHESRTALDGVHGSEVAKEFQPDVIFVDLLMPERAGLETMVALRSEIPTAKLVAMTGQPMVGDVSLLDLAKRFGADGVLAKPFTISQVSDLVNQVLSC